MLCKLELAANLERISERKVISCLIWLLPLTFLCRYRRRSSESLIRHPVLVVTVRSNQNCWVCIHTSEGAEEQGKYSGQFSACWIKCLRNTWCLIQELFVSRHIAYNTGSQACIRCTQQFTNRYLHMHTMLLKNMHWSGKLWLNLCGSSHHIITEVTSQRDAQCMESMPNISGLKRRIQIARNRRRGRRWGKGAEMMEPGRLLSCVLHLHLKILFTDPIQGGGKLGGLLIGEDTREDRGSSYWWLWCITSFQLQTGGCISKCVDAHELLGWVVHFEV